MVDIDPSRLLMTDADLVRPGPLKDAFDGKAESVHAETHSVGGDDPITPEAIGAISAQERTSRTNGLIDVWVQEGVTPSDEEGGYAGGDSTSNALAYLQHRIDTTERGIASITSDPETGVATVLYSDGETDEFILPGGVGAPDGPSVAQDATSGRIYWTG